ncbi:MAG: SHOCT domain-containing protein [Deltaproteobacteria bacterium]
MKSGHYVLITLMAACIASGCASLDRGLSFGGALPPRSSPQSSTQQQPTLVKSTNCVATTETPAETIPLRLKKLKELKDSGAITEEEYQVRRKALVEQL